MSTRENRDNKLKYVYTKPCFPRPAESTRDDTRKLDGYGREENAFLALFLQPTPRLLARR